MKKSNCLYLVDSKMYEQIYETSKKFYKKLQEDIKREEINIYDIPSYLFAIAEIYDYYLDKEELLENIYLLLEMIKHNKNKFLPIAAFKGMTEIAKAIYAVYKSTSHFENASQQINGFLENNVFLYIQNLKRKRDIIATDYDFIGGITGAGYYLLECGRLQNNSILKKEISDYLYWLLGFHYEMGMKIPNWEIIEPRFYKEQNTSRPEGDFDFGTAHGIIGPALLLAKMYNKDLVSEEAKSIIEQVVKIYESFSFEKDNCIFWPGRLTQKEYMNGKKDIYNRRVSWCYGNIGVTRCLYLIGSYIGNSWIKREAMQNIINISKLDIEKYYLSSPIICHGYGGVLMILESFYRDNVGKDVLEKRIFEIANIVNDQVTEYLVTNEGKHFDNNSLIEGMTGGIMSLVGIVNGSGNLAKYFMME